jgi:Flp pilus assembly protein TadD
MRLHILKSALLASALALTTPSPSFAQEGVAGPYLAARLAGFASDYSAAAEYYGQLLQRDPERPQVLDAAMISFAMLGDFDRAGDAAAKALSLEPNMQIARMVRLVRDVSQGNTSAAKAALDEGIVGGPLLDGLLQGWVELAEGNMSQAVTQFEALSENRAFSSFAYIHKALALAMVGDYESADAILSGETHGTLSLNVTAFAAHAQILVQLDRRDDAITLLSTTLQRGSSPELEDLLARIEAGEDVPYDIITTAIEGMSESFATLAAVVNGEASPTYTLLHSRAALVLHPTNVDAILLTADLLEQQEQYALASAVLDAVPATHPSFYLAEISRAGVLYSDGRGDTAVEVLKSLARSHGDIREVHTALGDTLRRLERHGEAAVAYEAAVALIGDATPRDWFLYYVRGIAYERTDRWPEAEADFRTALELNPDQPHVLNYLGYSMVEKQGDLDEALDMIEKAVAAQPEDGYITDSLGWVFYRLGRFEEAVAPMERAVELEPTDPVINDHLGDVYWAVGRKREAEFQWRRALSNVDPEDTDSEADPARMRRKLDVGLDVVLREEGAISLAEKAENAKKRLAD